MPLNEIKSSQNKLVKHLIKLRDDKSYRQKHNQVLVINDKIIVCVVIHRETSTKVVHFPVIILCTSIGSQAIKVAVSPSMRNVLSELTPTSRVSATARIPSPNGRAMGAAVFFVSMIVPLVSVSLFKFNCPGLH